MILKTPFHSPLSLDRIRLANEERDTFVSAEVAKGCEEIIARIRYDMELAPWCREIDLLRSNGLVWHHDCVTGLSDEGIEEFIVHIAQHMELWGVYITGTNHLSARQLYERLFACINEPTRYHAYGGTTHESISFADDKIPDMTVEKVVLGSLDEAPPVTGRDATFPQKKLMRHTDVLIGLTR